MLLSFFIIFHRMGRDPFRHGDETIWTPGHTVLDTGDAVDFQRVLFIYAQFSFWH